MQESNSYEESKTEIILGVVLVALFVLVVIVQSSTSLNTQSMLSNLFF